MPEAAQGENVQTRQAEFLTLLAVARHKIALVYETGVCVQAINYLNETYNKIHCLPD